jgi:Tfp pilus assembly protein PilF
VFYPHPGEQVSWIGAAIAAAALAAVTVAVWRLRRRAPCLLVGWLWYVGLLVPVIGVVQVGWQAMADRYTYVPLIGVFVALVWGIEQRVRGRADVVRLTRVVAAVAVVALMVLTSLQVRHQKDARSLFERALALDPDNYVAHKVVGMVDLQERRLESALAHLREAVRLRPDYTEAHYNLGALLASAGSLDEAIGHFEAAVESAPEAAQGHVNLGMALEMAGRSADAEADFRRALELDPANEPARARLGRLSGR